jgi:hypothetical protein
MNDDTQATEAIRRSGRERKQVISVYTEAKKAAVAERRRKKKTTSARNSGGQRNTR